MTIKREAGPITIFLLILFQIQFFCGCAGTGDAERVNEAVLRARRHNYTTERCLQLARRSRKMLSQRDMDYRIGGGDVLDISVRGLERRGEFTTVTVRVEESGVITFSLLPPVSVKGLTAGELEKKLNSLIVEMDFIKDPRVGVIVREFRSKNIAVLGAVIRPGEYTIQKNSITLYEALAMAGGPSSEAGYALHVIRGCGEDDERISGPFVPETGESDETITVDLISLMKEADLELNLLLHDDDIVYIPEAEYFYVIGFVNSPGGFPLNRPMRVLDGIAVASGLIPKEASPSECALKRIEGDREVVIPLDLVAIVEGEEPNFFLMPDDIIDVRQTKLRFFALEAWDWIKRIFTFSYQLNKRAYDRN